ncbi:HEAT repeat domain-containing protein [Hymenobacter sp. GOD-10R]|uniref:HEAT repeat domain-containing protein n=1 Tax=Hymenobacter sp. GOD-10R TaxID=3093922 RepID=UPI002D79F60C|nr:HEAT repeat domain-containing protein [Hymenobacter sp. GOD-10R]WRQ30763.1 HEAT repeat domain-containing protein [Hymenobacter sp. GOD-10R]
MNCEHAQEQLIDYLNHELPEVERATVAAHLEECTECREELQAMQKVWYTMSGVPVPEPSENVRPAFYAMLASYKEETQTKPSSWAAVWQWLQDVFTPQQALRLAYSLALVGVGVAVGFWLNKQQPAPTADNQQLATLTKQVADMRQVMLLSLIDNPSATERLRAVSYTKELSTANPKVVEALLSTLNHDENVNVRLATLEALTQLAQEPAVRQGLVQSLTHQESPLVQSALADVMVQLQEKRSVKPLRRLLKDPELNEAVRGKIKESLKSLSNGQPVTSTPNQPYDETFHSPPTDGTLPTTV